MKSLRQIPVRFTQAGAEESTVPIMTFPDQSGQRYYAISQFYKQRFGEKVYKIAVSVANTCPNRQGTDGSGCIFCDEWGSAGVHQTMNLSLEEQILQNRAYLKKRFKVNKFLVYFQAFSNTFTRISELESNMALALNQQQVYGIIVGTRPDCLPSEVFDLFKRFAEQSFVSVELGVQSFNDKQLHFLKRGHTADQSIEAIRELHKLTGVHVGIHLIFGLPGETESDIIETAQLINELPVDSVKLHNLHVLRNTPLESYYHKQQFQPLDLDTYADRVILFLEHLSPAISIQRLAAYAGPDSGLIAPHWTSERLRPAQEIQNRMTQRKTCQGIHWQDEMVKR